MNYLIFGTGAVGGLIGTRLALAGQQVSFLARPKKAAQIKAHGLKLTGDGPPGWLHEPIISTSLTQAINHFPIEVILLTVKAYDCQEAAETLKDVIADPPPVVCLLNGIGNEETLASRLGPQKVIAASLTTAVQMVEPGLLKVERNRGLGLADDHPLAPAIHREMLEAGLQPRMYDNRDRLKWSKLLTNIVSNATSAITGWAPNAIFEHPGLCQLEIQALREAVRVMRRMGLSPQNLPKVPVGLLGKGIFLPATLIQPILRAVVSSGRGDKLPSFHYDIGKGRSEVNWLNGAVVREGAKLDVPTPANRVLTETMMDLVENREDPATSRDRPESLLLRAEQFGVPGL